MGAANECSNSDNVLPDLPCSPQQSDNVLPDLPCSSQQSTPIKSKPIESTVPLTPNSAMRAAVVRTITPPMSAMTSKVLQNKKAMRKRIQKRAGECLTSEESLQRRL